MEIRFAQLCQDAQFLSALRPCVDRSGDRGQSYEFPRCRMPEGCLPAWVQLGFFRREDGSYVMYWRPKVAYRGGSRVLGLLFQQCLWSFDSYELLCARMRSLCAELAAPRPERSGPARPLPAPEKKLPPRPFPPPRPRGDGGQGRAGDWPVPFPALRRALGERIYGQQEGVDAAAYYLSGHISKCAPARPLSLIFYGQTGVGKSELAKAIAPVLERLGTDRWQFVWTELNTFTQPHSIHRLTGAPPGYVGYEDEPVLSAVRENPRTVFMFDELDKAHPDVWKIFMSILDEGRCSVSRVAQDGQRELDFRNCIFLFTTNLDLSAPAGRTMGFAPAQTQPFLSHNTAAATPEELAQRLFIQNELGRKALVHHGVLQEIAGRFTGFIGFSPLSEGAQRQILAQKAIALGAEYGLSITRVTPEAAGALLPAEQGFSIRSAICLLEARLAPLYQQAAAAKEPGAAYQLSLASGRLALSSEGCAAAG